MTSSSLFYSSQPKVLTSASHRKKGVLKHLFSILMNIYAIFLIAYFIFNDFLKINLDLLIILKNNNTIKDNWKGMLYE